MNKLVVISILLVAASVAAIGTVSELASQQQAFAQCRSGSGVNVQVCNNQVCATVSVISKDVSTRCE
jgi:hypothetical protein